MMLHVCANAPSHTLFLNQTHTHTHSEFISEGVSSSTFPLHQSLQPLPRLPAARGLLTCPFVAELCICTRVCVNSQHNTTAPTRWHATLCLTCLNKSFLYLLWIHKQSLSNTLAMFIKASESCHPHIFVSCFLWTTNQKNWSFKFNL